MSVSNGEPAATEAKRFQFRVLHLMVATTGIAACMAAGHWVSYIGAFFAGLFLASIWLNAFGWFDSLQAEQPVRFRLVLVGLALFLISLMLPAIGKGIFDGFPGWVTAWISASFVFSSLEEGEFASGMFFTCLSIANLMILFSWTGVRKKSRPRYEAVFVPILICALAAAFTLGMDLDNSEDPKPVFVSQMSIGYYVWCSSFLVVLLAYRIEKKAAIAATVMLVFWTAFGLSDALLSP